MPDEEMRDEKQRLLENLVWIRQSGGYSKTDQVWVKFSLKTSIAQLQFGSRNSALRAAQAKDFSTCSKSSPPR